MCGLQAVPCTDHIELGLWSMKFSRIWPRWREKNNITLEQDGDGVMTGSDTLIYRLLFNLTRNAIKYNPPRRLCAPFRHAGTRKAADPGVRHGRGIRNAFSGAFFSPSSGWRSAAGNTAAWAWGFSLVVGDRQTPRRYRVRGRTARRQAPPWRCPFPSGEPL